MGTEVKFANRACETTTTTGTSTYQLGGAPGGTLYYSFATAGITTGSRVSYIALDSLTSPTNFEMGEGVFTTGSPATLSRVTARGRTDGTAAFLSWASGTKYIFLVPLSQNLPSYDTTGYLRTTAPSGGDNSTFVPTTAWVQTELAAKAAVNSPTFTGVPASTTPSAADNSTRIATTAFVQGEIAGKAPLASPALTGTPTAPTPSGGDNSTKIATTAFLRGEFTGSNQLLGVNGYQKVPGGVIDQWHFFAAPTGVTTWTFATAFPSQCRNVVCSFASGTPNGHLVVGTPTTTQVGVDNQASSTVNIFARALGH
jgi:hypothetical protein